MKRVIVLLAAVLALAGCSHMNGGAVEDAAARTVAAQVAVGDTAGPDNAASAERDTVVRVHDGDTFYTLHHPDGVRIIGADTPEITNNSHGKVGCWGSEATARLKQLLPDAGPVLLIVGHGTSHNRILATVQTTGHVDVAAVLIEEGLAVALNIKPNVEHAAEYNHLQAAAQAAHVGEWSGTNPPDAPKGCVNPTPKDDLR